MPYRTAVWQSISQDLGLFRYKESGQIAEDGNPILMLHSTMATHEAWNSMAHQMAVAGMHDIYAIDIPEICNGVNQWASALAQLHSAIDFILSKHPEYKNIVLMGFGVGGSLAYEYWQTWGDEARLDYLIMLATPHAHTMFPDLSEQTIHGTGTDENGQTYQTYTNPVDFNRIGASHRGQTVVVNIYGAGVGIDFDGVVRGLWLPEAVNKIFPLRHHELNKNEQVMQFILECLRGARYQVQLKLVGLQMRRADDGEFSGPVSFDVEGVRTPPDTVFKPMTDRLYLFEETVPPLCTLSYPIKAVSAMLTLHLRDLSQAGTRRRRMYLRLHTPLIDGHSTAHTMQDSEGSDFLWRIVCKKMPTSLGTTWYDRSSQIVRF